MAPSSPGEMTSLEKYGKDSFNGSKMTLRILLKRVDSDVKPVKKLFKVIPDHKAVGISAYEKMIQQRKRESMAFLQSLKIEEVRADLSRIVNTVKKKNPAKTVEKIKKDYSLLPVRKSRRLQNSNGNFSEKGLLKGLPETMNFMPSEMSFEYALKSGEMYENFTKDITINYLESEEKKISYDDSVLKKLTLKDLNVATIAPEKIASLAWYPSAENLILAAGSRKGYVGMWNINSGSDPHLFKVHCKAITHLQFNPFNSVEMFSSSNDGILRCGDMVQNKFFEVFNMSDETSCSYFDFLASTTYLVTLRNEKIALVDRRTSKKSEMKFIGLKYTPKTVNVHPVNNNVFVTAEINGSVRLWDLRKLQKEPIADIIHHKRSVNSAFFSSVTGNSLLTTSLDDTVCLFDSTNLTQDIKLVQSMKHEITNTWDKFMCRAEWLPNSDDMFIVGSLQDYPRAIQIYNKDMNIRHLLMHENLTTITSCHALHPFVPSLAGADSSGKVFVFT